MKNKLLPCPFCGEEAYRVANNPELIGCLGCSVEFYVNDGEDPRELWNTRTPKKRGWFYRFVFNPIKFIFVLLVLTYIAVTPYSFSARSGMVVKSVYKEDDGGYLVYVKNNTRKGFKFYTNNKYEVGDKLVIGKGK